MFKRLPHIVLALLLVFSSVGVTISRHYCGNTLVSTSLFGVPHSCCGSQCKACHNVTISCKITDSFVASSFTVESSQTVTFQWDLATLCDLYSGSVSSFMAINANQFLKSPPLPGNVPAYLQVFRC